LMSPVVATLLGFVLLHQTLTPIQLIGMGIVLMSVLIGQQTDRLRQRLSNTLKSRIKK
jgi:probable blue pigment (indigoidine) exporter